MPDIPCPFPFSVNPHVERARAHLADWTRSTELISRPAARERFERADFGWFAGLVYPTASPQRLDLMADWFAWLFLVDDQLDDGAFGRSPERVAEAVGLMRAVLAGPGPVGRRELHHLPPAVASLADLWRRTAAGASPQWRHRFAVHLDQCLTTAATWEADNRVHGRVPSEDSYITNRRHTGAIYVCMDLIEIVEDIDVPPALYDSQSFRAALDAACNVVCWVNDVYSLAKERSLGEIHNLVHLVRHHRGLDDEQALREVCAAIGRETDRYLAAEARVVREHPRQAEVLLPCLAGMRTWMRGNLDWSRRTERYGPDASAERPETYLESTLMGTGQ
ncbi:terpene cyclase [Streptomyces sp. NPDC049837]|uniref:terpene synthase family protein n=1 Tax=Streptomyces sp. NPDC049837 TaxID=3155277 RepID=UPI003440F51F